MVYRIVASWFETAQERLLTMRRSTATPLSFLLHHLLGGLPEHVLSRLLVERRLFEFADRKTRLHLRPRAHLGIPALEVRIIVERRPLRLVRHGPCKAADIASRIVSGDESTGLTQSRIKHAI